jgi:predicted DNA-binding protein (MmcQ/YjbR family)
MLRILKSPVITMLMATTYCALTPKRLLPPESRRGPQGRQGERSEPTPGVRRRPKYSPPYLLNSSRALMNVPQLKKFCRRFPSATETLYGEPSNFLVYSVGGKKFAYFKTSQPEKWRFSTRVASDRFIELTDVPGVKPARYRGRFHWITIVNVQAFPAAYLKKLVDWSYQRAFASLSKAKQNAIRGSA